MDFGYTVHRQCSVRRSKQIARLSEKQQGTQPLLLLTAYTRHIRNYMAIIQSTERQTAVLAYICTVLYDRYSHSVVCQPDTISTPRTRLLVCRFVLCLLYMDRFRYACFGKGFTTVAAVEVDIRTVGFRIIYGYPSTYGSSELGRPRPFGTLCVQRYGLQLP